MAEKFKKYTINFDEDNAQKFVLEVGKGMAEAEDKKKKNEEKAKDNLMYWRQGSLKEDEGLFRSRWEKLVLNRIFTNVETSIPMLTSNVPDPTVQNVDNTNREKISGMLRDDYEVHHKMQQKLQKMLRSWYINRIGILKYRWDYKQDRMVTENVLPKKIWFADKATGLHNCEFIIEELEERVAVLADKFDKEKELLAAYPELKGKIKYYEVWFQYGECVAWVIPEKFLILDKIKNPNYDYGMDATQPKESSTQYLPQPKVEGKNVFKFPQFPYLLLNVFNLGDESGVYDDTSFIEQAALVLDGVTQLERQTIKLWEGQKRVWAVNAQAMSQDSAQRMVNKTGDLLAYFDGSAPANSITIPMSGKPDGALYEHINHLIGEIDNIFGVHSVLRGDQTKKEGLGAKKMDLSTDLSRFDLIVRNIEQLMEDWYLADIQMMKVYATDSRMFEVKQKQIVLQKDEIPDELVVIVKKGSTLPIDDRSRMDMAINLAKIGMIDPVTLFTELSYGKEEERRKALYEWLMLTGKINPQALQQLMGQQPQQGQPTSGQPPNSQVTSQTGQASKQEQLAKLQQILSDPRIKQMPLEAQQKILQQAKTLMASLGQQQ